MDFEEIAEILKEQTIKNHPEIAIIVIYGSRASGDYNEFSDLDMFAIIDNDEKKFSVEFVFDNKTVDFWCISWSRIEKIANAEVNPIMFPVGVGLILNNRIIYARSDEDSLRFEEIKKTTTIAENRQIQLARNNFYHLNNLIHELQLAKKENDILTARWAAWNFINGTVCMLAFANSKILFKNWGSNLQETFKFEILPEDYERDISILATSDDFDELILSRKRLNSRIREILKKKNRVEIDPKKHIQELAQSYLDFKSYLNKILSACTKKDILAASYAATEIQLTIADELERTETNKDVNSIGFDTYFEVNNTYNRLGFPDLSVSITKQNFEQITKDVLKIDKMLVDYLREKKVELRIFENVSEVKEYASTK